MQNRLSAIAKTNYVNIFLGMLLKVNAISPNSSPLFSIV